MGTARVSTPAKVSFLDLPPELRLKIYRYLFILDIALLEKPWPSYLDFDFDDPEPKSATVANLEKTIPTFKSKIAASPQLLQTWKLFRRDWNDPGDTYRRGNYINSIIFKCQ